MTGASAAARQRELLERARKRRAGTRASEAARTAAAAEDTGRTPLSDAQRRMWLMDRLGQGGPLYNVPVVTRVYGPLDLDALRTALTEVLRRHPVLRGRYAEADGEPYQEAAPLAPPHIEVEDADPETGAAAVRAAAARPFTLAEGTAPRVLVVRHAPDHHTVALTFHHICVDGESLPVVLGAIGSVYGDVVAGRPPAPPGPVPQYADFVRRERAHRTAIEEGLAYWTGRLEGARPVPLPAPPPRPDGPRRGDGGVLEEPLEPGLIGRLRAAGVRHRATLYACVLTAAFAALRAETGQEDLVVGCVSSLRDGPGTRDLVGLCVNTLPIRATVPAAGTYAELLAGVRHSLFEAQQHRRVPFDLIVERLGAAVRDQDSSPLVNVMADILAAPPALRLPGVRTEAVPVDLGTAKFGVGFCVAGVEEDDAPRCLVQYDRARVGTDTARAFLRAFSRALRALADDPLSLPDPPRPDAATATHDVPHRPRDESSGAPTAPGHRTRAVLDVFRELLGDDPGPDDDFFLLGGHSLKAVRAADGLRERLALPVTGLDVMEHPTPSALGTLLDERARQRDAVRHAPARRPGTATSAGTVLVTGATGGVGGFVLDELAARGIPVRALARPESAYRAAAAGAEVCEGDLTDPASLREAMRGADAVIHAASTFTSPEVDLAAMRTLLESWRHGPFVFVSSTDAYGSARATEVTAEVAAQEPLTPYGRAKLECERLLLGAAGTGGRGGASAVRTPIVWGAHDRLREQLRRGATGALFQAVRAGKPVELPDPGLGWYGTSWVHAAALARVLTACVAEPAGGTVNAVSGHVTWHEWTSELIRLLGSDSRINHRKRLSPHPDAPDLLHQRRYLPTGFARELTPRPRENWQETLAAMLKP
ncbi:condensation domain-containing protein [Streptomyces sp. NPDC050759]|uniref:condensation domain-containing protein n=1 Tax=Streptomyces sp. NPDC050759 TaxID=3365635 RepID=UPI0037AD24C7